MIPEVDNFLETAKKWQAEMAELRRIVLDCQLEEHWKWRVPCYVFNGANVLLFHGFKEYCAIGFFKGALLSNLDGKLVQAGENSQSSRQFRFTSVEDILASEALIKATIFEAIEIEKAGLKVVTQKEAPSEYPEELTNQFELSSAFKNAFQQLTPGRQRAYLLFFNGAKQSATKSSRIESMRKRIMNGKGINDCVCGLSKRMPGCDGSHKYSNS